MNRVLRSSPPFSAACTASGCVVSSAVNGLPPNVVENTSGARLEPPIPRRTIRSNPAQLSANSCNWSICSCIFSGSASQPRRSLISVGSGFQTVWSSAQMRRGTPALSRPERRFSNGFASEPTLTRGCPSAETIRSHFASIPASSFSKSP